MQSAFLIDHLLSGLFYVMYHNKPRSLLLPSATVEVGGGGVVTEEAERRLHLELADWLDVVVVDMDLRALRDSLQIEHITCKFVSSRLLQFRECTCFKHVEQVTSGFPLFPCRLHTRKSV